MIILILYLILVEDLFFFVTRKGWRKGRLYVGSCKIGTNFRKKLVLLFHVIFMSCLNAVELIYLLFTYFLIQERCLSSWIMVSMKEIKMHPIIQ